MHGHDRLTKENHSGDDDTQWIKWYEFAPHFKRDECTRSHRTSDCQSVLVLLVAGEQNTGVEVFAGELLPRRRQVFLLVHTFHLHVQYDVEKLRVFLRGVACIQVRSEKKDCKSVRE